MDTRDSDLPPSSAAPLIVEFSGLPGAGKTTTAHRVVALLEARGYRCARRPPIVRGKGSRLRHSLRLTAFRLASWRLHLASLRYLASLRFRLSAAGSLRHALFLAYYLRQLRANEHDVVLMPQGVVQALWGASVHGGRSGSSELDRLLGDAYRQLRGSIAFVFFDVPPARAAERVVRRGQPENRFDMLPLAEAEQVLGRHQPSLRALGERAAELAGAPTCVIDGSAPVEASAERIADFVEGLLRPRGHASPPDPRRRRAGRPLLHDGHR